MKKLHKIFSHSFEHRIWRIVPCLGTQDLLIEERDEELSRIYVHRYQPGGPLQKVVPEGMAWWSTLISGRESIFITRSYGSDGNAGTKDLTGFDSQTGRIKWELQDAELLAEENDWMHIQRQGRQEWLSPETAVALSGPPIKDKPIENKQDLFPFRYTEGTAHFSTIATFLSKNQLPDPKQVIDYLEMETGIIISLYCYEDEKLTNRLYVFDLSGDILFEKEIGKNLNGISDNTFFIYNGNLIFVTSRNDFFEYSLA